MCDKCGKYCLNFLDKCAYVSKSSEIWLIKKYACTFFIDNYHFPSLYNGSSTSALVEILMELKFWNPK